MWITKSVKQAPHFELVWTFTKSTKISFLLRVVIKLRLIISINKSNFIEFNDEDVSILKEMCQLFDD